MKKIQLYSLLVFMQIQGCAQQTKQGDNMNQITLENIVEKWQENIKHYDVEPFYKIHSNGINCYYELLVNDFPVYKN